MNEHKCFDKLVEETGSDATFEKAISFHDGEMDMEWVINLYRYTPSLRISRTRGKFIPNFCPICGKDLRDE